MEDGDELAVEVDGEAHLDGTGDGAEPWPDGTGDGGFEPWPDGTGDGGSEVHTGLPPRFEAWRRRSATGAILTGISLGLKQVFEPKRDEPAIVMEASGEPLGDLAVEAEVGGILPADNVVRIRPWLLAPTELAEPDRASPAAAPAAQPGSGETP